MFKYLAVVVLAAAIVAAAGLVVGEMRYRDCVQQRDRVFNASQIGRIDWGRAKAGPSYAGCSHWTI